MSDQSRMPSDSRLPTPDSPRFAVLTPSGRGAIATVAIRGKDALAAVARRFDPASGRELASLPVERIVFGRFQTSATTSEELVVGLIAPNEVEIHCHGGKVAADAICDALKAEGCQQITPDLWAIENESDPLAAQALLTLSEARTERTAAILLDQYRGAMRNEVSKIERALEQNNVAAAETALDALIARAALGLHLTQPWKVVLAGRPNAGKSSLMNAILGYQRSIVWHEPGTTRDVLTATTAIDGWPIELTDTAGLRREGEAPAEPIEAEGMIRAEGQIAAADLVLWVVDATAPRRIGLRPALQDQKGLLVLNKIDLVNDRHQDRQLGIQASALTGQGIETLCQAISQSLVPDPPPPMTAVPFTIQQVAALRAIADTLKTGNVDSARESSRAFPGYNRP